MNKYKHFSKAKDKQKRNAVSMCLRKAQYRTEEKALAGVGRLNERLGLDTSRAYQCPQCGQWHITRGERT